MKTTENKMHRPHFILLKMRQNLAIVGNLEIRNSTKSGKYVFETKMFQTIGTQIYNVTDIEESLAAKTETTVAGYSYMFLDLCNFLN